MDTQKALTIVNQDTPSYLELLGSAANHAAARNVLSDYQARKAQETLRRQAADIKLFETYLAQAGLVISDMALDLEAWSGVTWGLVEGFSRWQLEQGYAIGSINVRLATVKAYCELASKHGSLDAAASSLVRTVKGYRQLEGRNVDDKRDQTRRPDAKKADPVSISLDQARGLKQQPATKKGRRDSLLMSLLLDLGLRVGEVASLNVSSINLEAGTLTFYRHKVNLWQTLNLEADTWRAARAYLEQEQRDQASPLFSGPCSGERMSERTINARVEVLGAKIGLVSLSPHDCRHYWATNAMRAGTDVKSLQDAGGWSSPAMPLRYAESSKIANHGVKLTM